MKKFVLILAVFVFGFYSCVTPESAKIDYSYPSEGVTNNVSIAGKDFESIGIIFVNSVEIIDTEGNHTGSKITYSMLMREAERLGADDVINIKIDVNKKEEKVKSASSGFEVFVTTYSYTGTGLAIKYTEAIKSDDSKKASFSSVIIPPPNDMAPPAKKKSKAGLVLGLVLGGALLAGGSVLIASLVSG